MIIGGPLALPMLVQALRPGDLAGTLQPIVYRRFKKLLALITNSSLAFSTTRSQRSY